MGTLESNCPHGFCYQDQKVAEEIFGQFIQLSKDDDEITDDEECARGNSIRDIKY